MTGGAAPLGVSPALRPTLPSCAEVRAKRLGHIQRVAQVVSVWAETMGIPDS